MTLSFVNSELEELMLAGRGQKSATGHGFVRHTGSCDAPRNTTETMLGSIDAVTTDNPELEEVFEAIDNL